MRKQCCQHSHRVHEAVLSLLCLATCQLLLHAVAAIVATRNDDMLRDLFKHMSEFDLSFFSNSTASQFLRHFLLKGTLQDIEVLQKRLRRLLGDLTFLEAFNLSGERSGLASTRLLACSTDLRPGLRHAFSSSCQHKQMSCQSQQQLSFDTGL